MPQKFFFTVLTYWQTPVAMCRYIKTAWLCAVQVILQEADFANNDHLQETIEAAQVRTEIAGYTLSRALKVN